MATQSAEIILSDEARTRRFAAVLGAELRHGDTLLLAGDIGAGKTAFARALIRSLQIDPEDVPSPTFTLVQVYETTRGEVWHADLYRIGTTSEIEELGLTDAFAEAICLIEWPDRLGDLAPSDALSLNFAARDPDSDARSVLLSWRDSRWTARVARAIGELAAVAAR